MAELVRMLGDPQKCFPVIHITGTNGKGSTAAMISALLAQRGLAVGTYTSPDLENICERIMRNGEAIPEDDLAASLEAVAAVEGLVSERPWRFEILTAAAYSWFSEVAVDIAVIEVGLGGLYDATNVADASVAVVTNIGLDHIDVLGPSVESIAKEKSGIVKPGSVLVLGETEEPARSVLLRAPASRVVELGRDIVIEQSTAAVGGRLVEVRTPLQRYPFVLVPLYGAHQAANAGIAIAAAEAFFEAPLPIELVREAMLSVKVPGRMEIVGRDPLVILDGAHNPDGARAVGRTLAEEFSSFARRVVVLGVLGGHDPGEMLDALGTFQVAGVVAVEPPSPRAISAGEVEAAASERNLACRRASGVQQALEEAIEWAGEEGMVLVTGSLYLVGAARSLLVEPPAAAVTPSNTNGTASLGAE